MNLLLETLSDAIWQALTIALVLAALLMLMVVRTRDAHLSAARKRLESRLVLVVCLVVFVLMSDGEILFHSQQALPPQVSSRAATTIPTTVPQASPTLTSVPSPSPTPTATPRLARSITAVLTTFCNAIDQHDLNGAWGQYATRLQKERTESPPPHGWFKIVECSIGEVSDTSATGLLQLQTIEPAGYADGVERPFQFTLDVEDGAWKISQIARCFSDGCLDVTPTIVPW